MSRVSHPLPNPPPLRGRGGWSMHRTPSPAKRGRVGEGVPTRQLTSSLMALPASFMDELRLRTPLAAVVGRRVRLARSGRQWKGCCPFHGEKTPSFYVYEDGHYHCFGCGAHGDAIGFVMQSEGAAFMEAVERLASRSRPGSAKALARSGGSGTPPPRPRLRPGGRPGQLPAPPVPARGPPRARLPPRPRPLGADDPQLRPRLDR